MRRRTTTLALSLTLLLLMPEGPGARTAIGLEPLGAPAADPRSTTVEAHADPVVVQGDLSANTHGWGAAASDPTDTGDDISGELRAAYSLAVAMAPPECHLSVSVLAAIGQVESGGLAGHRIDAAHRAVPDIVGPALDGKPFRAVEDTDGGRWDGDRVWDHAVGPMQFIPSSWRVVGVDMDGDGVRDPQDIYDAAGAAMVYLCADGRDLATVEGLREAVMAYNHSLAYLEQVLAWKAAFDLRELTGWAVPVFDARPTPTAPGIPSTPARSGVLSNPTQPPAQPPAQTPVQTPAHTSVDAGTRPGPTPAPLTGPEPTSAPLPGTTEPPPPPSSPPASPAEPEPKPEPEPEPSPVPPCPPPVDPTIPVDPSVPALPEPPPPEPSPGTTALPAAEGATEGPDTCLPAPDPAAGPTTSTAPSESN